VSCEEGILMENRIGLFVEARLTKVSGHAERLAALDLIEPHVPTGRIRSRLEPTKATTPQTSSWNCVRST
jgi:hypothetical protein